MLSNSDEDERVWWIVFTSLFVGWASIAVGAILFTWIHEGLHVLGAMLTGGEIIDYTLFNAGAWFSTYIAPSSVESLGGVTANIPNGMSLGIYYLLPYIVLIPASLIMIIYSVMDDGYDWLLFFALPLLYTHFIAFFNDYSLMVGLESTMTPPLPITKAVYFFCLSGIVSILFVRRWRR